MIHSIVLLPFFEVLGPHRVQLCKLILWTLLDCIRRTYLSRIPSRLKYVLNAVAWPYCSDIFLTGQTIHIVKVSSLDPSISSSYPGTRRNKAPCSSRVTGNRLRDSSDRGVTHPSSKSVHLYGFQTESLLLDSLVRQSQSTYTAITSTVLWTLGSQ